MSAKCQSCGMPLSKDENGGGTNLDGTLSEEFCSNCYKNGMFVDPDFTVAEMQQHCIKQLRKSGMPHIVAWFVTRSIPKLDRWTSG